MVNQYNATLLQHMKWMKEMIEKIHRYTNNMRNFLVHTYHKIDIDIIRKTIQQSIPSLEQKINILMTKD